MKKSKREIKNLVNQLLKKHNLLFPPVSLDRILQREDIKYIEKDFEDLDLEENVDALIYKDDDIKFIVVNSKAHLYNERKRFSIAHELGHLFLHFSDNQKQYVAFRSQILGENRIEETEANIFAANLLIPDEMVEQEYFEMEVQFLSILAKKFKVSKAAMKLKLDELGLGYIDA